MLHHHISVQEVAPHLGEIVVCHLHDGNPVYGRLEAVDEWKLYLGRAHPPSTTYVNLSDIKSIDYAVTGEAPG